MSDATNRIVQKLWSYCNVLRDDGLSYQDYLEQLTFLLFLKMADERERLTGERQPIPAGYRWENLASPTMEGAELERNYRETLRILGAQGGMLGLIFEKAQNRIQDPAKLRRLIVELIGREDWSAMAADVKGDAYEGLLEKNAQDVKGGAGQYFTPRALIQAMVDCVQPRPGEVVVDPACGTGGFLLAAHEYLKRGGDLDRDQKRHLRFDALRGVELVPNVARLCGMNLYLHGIGPDGGDRLEPPITTDDALRDTPNALAEVVITNPPFGKKSSITVVNAEGDTGRQSLTYNRPDFWTTTSNKQLNFVQHVKSLLTIHGRARGRRAGQRAVRRRSRRDGAQEPAARVRGAHPAAPCAGRLPSGRGPNADRPFDEPTTSTARRVAAATWMMSSTTVASRAYAVVPARRSRWSRGGASRPSSAPAAGSARHRADASRRDRAARSPDPQPGVRRRRAALPAGGRRGRPRFHAVPRGGAGSAARGT